MTSYCVRCGCYCHLPEEQIGTLRPICQACSWELEPGDLVVCEHVQIGQTFLIKGWTYTVTALWKPRFQNMIRVYGSNEWWQLWQFRLCHKPGDTDLKTGF